MQVAVRHRRPCDDDGDSSSPVVTRCSPRPRKPSIGGIRPQQMLPNLFIAQRIVPAMQGELVVSSQPGVGMSFTFQIVAPAIGHALIPASALVPGRPCRA